MTLADKVMARRAAIKAGAYRLHREAFGGCTQWYGPDDWANCARFDDPTLNGFIDPREVHHALRPKL